MTVTALPRGLLTGSCNVDICSADNDGARAQRTEESASWLGSPLGWHKDANEPLGCSKASNGRTNAAE